MLEMRDLCTCECACLCLRVIVLVLVRICVFMCDCLPRRFAILWPPRLMQGPFEPEFQLMIDQMMAGLRQFVDVQFRKRRTDDIHNLDGASRSDPFL